MITDKQKQIIQLLISSKEGYNINQIAKISNLSISWTYDSLKSLLKQGFLTAEKKGNALIFKLNLENEKAKKLAEFVTLDSKPVYKTDNEVKVLPKETFSYSQIQNPVQASSGYSSKVSSGNFYNQPQGYKIAPIGTQGVNSVLNFYAASGAFGYSNNNTFAGKNQHYGSTGAVPPQTLGAKITDDISRFTLKDHTTTHNTSTVPGCNYCSPQPVVQ